jgi:mannose-6-phosphate isomerase-like protein (cupin superfamily)
MALAEERVASLDHRDGVAGARHQVDVALARYVEGVTALASEGGVPLRQLAPTDRTAEEIDGLVEHRGILAAMKVIRNDELPTSGASPEFVGEDHGVGISVILVEAGPGRGPSLHRHDYAEVFVVLEGQASFRGGDEQVEVPAGHMVVVPAGEPHGFKNSGDGTLRQVAIHVSPRFLTEWLESDADG